MKYFPSNQFCPRQGNESESMKYFRERIVARLKEDLAGPMSESEVLTDRPTQRYSTGILYPRDSPIVAEENEDGGLAVNETEDRASAADDADVSLHSALKPSAMGMSFAVKPDRGSSVVSGTLDIRLAMYNQVAVNDAGEEVNGPPSSKSAERWKRQSKSASVEIRFEPGEQRPPLPSDLRGIELYALVTPHAELLTVTVALSNRRMRGESRNYDEEQHAFQVELLVRNIRNGVFAPRPSRRAEIDEDGRIAALIYRDTKEHVVGHTCSASAVFGDDGVVSHLNTEWIPAAVVPGISDQGDKIFERLRSTDKLQPFSAGWLAKASQENLIAALREIAKAYTEWIKSEERKIGELPTELRTQAKRHIERCTDGANRMEQGIDAIASNEQIRLAFQLAQEAMQIQFGWSRKGTELTWRPFQIAFQMLVLASLAVRTHPDRETMDLLWFPTGGGKTEAYLALTAFVILLRRLRQTPIDDGAGVAVLMRYTLRLLTVQQFQRAAAMICACEMIRRETENGERPNTASLGTIPIGIGLWVGAAATPLTLRDALNLPAGDASTAEQLTSCPSCGAKLRWTITPKKSTVECLSERNKCAFARTGSVLPVWTISEEVYRYAPSLIIGTVDKFAQIVRNLETRVLFGRGTRNAPPDLIIQDELHLISGPLGSITGIYEVAIDELCRRDNIKAKIIGSTATIRRATEQARALFDRVTYQFPSPGLHANNSGFAVVDDKAPGRLHIGVTTAGRSATYMLQALAASLLQASAEDSTSVLEHDYYWTLVVYFNSLRELGRALVLMQDDVPVSLQQISGRRKESSRKIKAPAELTSRVRSYEIRDMLDLLAKHAGDPEAVDLLLASNMISVGMDIPRLGMMIVNAQPKTLSEYIQATSRVGRGDVPGLIVTMYNSTRNRDRSHYETFETWHRCLYRDVEATSVTPFASRAQDKALHAVLVALVRHLIPGMEQNPVLSDIRRPEVERLAALIEQRVARIDQDELAAVSQTLKQLIDQWTSRPDLRSYWDDYGKKASLLMSAEQFAAKADVDEDLDAGGARRALWPTPNSMREVEAGTPFVLRNVIKAEER